MLLVICPIAPDCHSRQAKKCPARHAPNHLFFPIAKEMKQEHCPMCFHRYVNSICSSYNERPMSLSTYYAAACQIDSPNPTTREEISQRTKRMLDMIEFAVSGYEPFFDVRLVAFPEFGH